MESISSIKTRIQGIETTRQITQSMWLVATAKVQKARARMEANRQFLEETEHLLRAAAAEPDVRQHRYLTPAAGEPVVVVVGADRGLCGGYNIGVCKEASALLKTLENPRLVTVGSKVYDFFRRRNRRSIAQSFTGISENPFPDDARELASLLLDWFHQGQAGEIHLVHTRFESMLVQTPISRRLLPLEPAGADSLYLEPSAESLLESAVPFYLSAALYGAILEAAACEQSARITSMDSAVKNADEMIDELTLRYNRARQDAITGEIIEIVGGAGAVQNS